MAYKQDFKKPKKPGFFARQTATNLLILINIVIFLLFLFADSALNYHSNSPCLSGQNVTFLEDNVFIQPCHIVAGERIWTVFTSIFMHAGFFHLFVNMFSLFFIGNLVERIIGRKRYIWFYLAAGIVGSLFFVSFAYLGQFIPRGEFVFGSPSDFAVGASGAIFGLLGLLSVILPRKEVYLIIGPLIVIVLQFLLEKLFPVASSVIDIVSTLLIFLMIFSMFSFNSRMRKLALPLRLQFWLAPIIAIVPLVLIGLFVKLPIGNSAHFGGLVAGLVYGAYLRNKYSKKVKMLNKFVR